MSLMRLYQPKQCRLAYFISYNVFNFILLFLLCSKRTVLTMKARLMLFEFSSQVRCSALSSKNTDSGKNRPKVNVFNGCRQNKTQFHL